MGPPPAVLPAGRHEPFTRHAGGRLMLRRRDTVHISTPPPLPMTQTEQTPATLRSADATGKRMAARGGATMKRGARSGRQQETDSRAHRWAGRVYKPQVRLPGSAGTVQGVGAARLSSRCARLPAWSSPRGTHLGPKAAVAREGAPWLAGAPCHHASITWTGAAPACGTPSTPRSRPRQAAPPPLQSPAGAVSRGAAARKQRQGVSSGRGAAAAEHQLGTRGSSGPRLPHLPPPQEVRHQPAASVY